MSRRTRDDILSLPWQPLATFLQDRYGPSSDGQTAVRIGVCRYSVIRWRLQHHEMTIRTGETIADELGVHPSAIWFDYWDRITDTTERRRLEHRDRQRRYRQTARARGRHATV